MKKILIFALFLGVCLGCSDDDVLRNNPNLFDLNVNLTLHLNLPQYADLNFVSNPIYISGYGNGGIVVMKTGENAYVAYDAADPNHPRKQACPAMEINGLRLVCPCEQNKYDLFTGNFLENENSNKPLKYTLYRYKATLVSPNVVNISDL